MTASTATSVPEVPTPERIALPHREKVIADIISHAAYQDRDLQAVERAIATSLGAVDGRLQAEAVVQYPVNILDAIGDTYRAVAEFSVALHRAIAELVDQGLEFNPEWEFDDASERWQQAKLEALFERAGIAERYVPAGPFLEEQS